LDGTLLQRFNEGVFVKRLSLNYMSRRAQPRGAQNKGREFDGMMLGKVIGTVVTTISHRDYKNRRLLVVQPLTLPGDPAEGDFIALDNSHAGIGDTVLVNREGNGARQALNNPDACVISVIVGIVDSLHLAELG
jgi:microcompartment protein CcmK/EutM